MGRRFRNACDLWTLCDAKSRNVLGVSPARHPYKRRECRLILRLPRKPIEMTETCSLCCLNGTGIRSFLGTKGIFRGPSKRSYWKPKTPVDSQRCEAIRGINIPRLSGNSKSGGAAALRRRSVNSLNSSTFLGCVRRRMGALKPE